MELNDNMQTTSVTYRVRSVGDGKYYKLYGTFKKYEKALQLLATLQNEASWTSQQDQDEKCAAYIERHVRIDGYERI